MSKYGSGSVSIYLEASTGTTYYNIANYIDELGGQKITSITEPTNAFGDSWEEHLPVGLSRGEPFDIGGLWDTAATDGTHVTFKDVNDGTTDATRGMVIGFGGGQYWHASVYIPSYEVIGSNGKLTRFRANVLPTGTVTWTTSTS